MASKNYYPETWDFQPWCQNHGSDRTCKTYSRISKTNVCIYLWVYWQKVTQKSRGCNVIFTSSQGKSNHYNKITLSKKIKDDQTNKFCFFTCSVSVQTLCCNRKEIRIKPMMLWVFDKEIGTDSVQLECTAVFAELSKTRTWNLWFILWVF